MPTDLPNASEYYPSFLTNRGTVPQIIEVVNIGFAGPRGGVGPIGPDGPQGLTGGSTDLWVVPSLPEFPTQEALSQAWRDVTGRDGVPLVNTQIVVGTTGVSWFYYAEDPSYQRWLPNETYARIQAIRDVADHAEAVAADAQAKANSALVSLDFPLDSGRTVVGHYVKVDGSELSVSIPVATPNGTAEAPGYLGGFATTAEVLALPNIKMNSPLYLGDYDVPGDLPSGAFSGQWADVLSTNTEWVYDGTVWANSGRAIGTTPNFEWFPIGPTPQNGDWVNNYETGTEWNFTTGWTNTTNPNGTRPTQVGTLGVTGLMPSSAYNTLDTIQADVALLRGLGRRVPAHLGAVPVTDQDLLSQTYRTALSWDSTYQIPNGATIVNLDEYAPQGCVYTYFDVGSSWIRRGTDTVGIANNTGALGVVTGEPTTAGMVYVETNGKMSLIGYDDIVDDIADLQSSVSGIIDGTVPANVPDASTTVKGIAKLAATSDVTSANTIVTPAWMAVNMPSINTINKEIVDTLTIYVSQTGNDAATGLASTAPVLTLQGVVGALERSGKMTRELRVNVTGEVSAGGSVVWPPCILGNIYFGGSGLIKDLTSFNGVQGVVMYVEIPARSTGRLTITDGYVSFQNSVTAVNVRCSPRSYLRFLDNGGSIAITGLLEVFGVCMWNFPTITQAVSIATTQVLTGGHLSISCPSGASLGNTLEMDGGIAELRIPVGDTLEQHFTTVTRTSDTRKFIGPWAQNSGGGGGGAGSDTIYIYVSPTGTGDGSSRTTPAPTLAAALPYIRTLRGFETVALRVTISGTSSTVSWAIDSETLAMLPKNVELGSPGSTFYMSTLRIPSFTRVTLSSSGTISDLIVQPSAHLHAFSYSLATASLTIWEEASFYGYSTLSVSGLMELYGNLRTSTLSTSTGTFSIFGNVRADNITCSSSAATLSLYGGTVVTLNGSFTGSVVAYAGTLVALSGYLSGFPNRTVMSSRWPA